MCADATELTFEAMLTDPLIRLVMQSDGVSRAELAALLCRAAEARAEPAPVRPRLALVHSASLPPPTRPLAIHAAAG